MVNLEGKYMVGLDGEGSWEGLPFDTEEEAIEAGRKSLREKDLEGDVTFGDWLDNILLMKDGDMYTLKHFI